RYSDLARVTNTVQRALASGDFAGGIWLEGSPTVEETCYWLSLLIDTDLPIACGFGISTAEHVAAVTAVADAAIVGSALVRRMADADDPVAAAGAFVRQLAAGLDGATGR
ncbi:MAG: tryptophan synthase subunit alpha, partial [Planctomycetes bacterium]|nr:tryptophan synthase subunit alpha [Planctomycetota bacterium]